MKKVVSLVLAMAMVALCAFSSFAGVQDVTQARVQAGLQRAVKTAYPDATNVFVSVDPSCTKATITFNGVPKEKCLGGTFSLQYRDKKPEVDSKCWYWCTVFDEEWDHCGYILATKDGVPFDLK